MPNATSTDTKRYANLRRSLMEAARTATEPQRVASVGSALERMEQGGYGICERCGSEISLVRLEAIPWAVRCMSCQERHERGS